MGLSAKSIDFLGNVHFLRRFSIKTFVLSCFYGGNYTSDIWLCQSFFHLWNNDMALADICVVVRTGKLVDDYMALFATDGIKLVPTETVFPVWLQFLLWKWEPGCDKMILSIQALFQPNGKTQKLGGGYTTFTPMIPQSLN